MSGEPGFAAYLRDSHWTLHRFRRRGLVTCDHPVSMDQADRGAWVGIGLATADVFCLPLSRRMFLTIQPRRRLEQPASERRLQLDADEVPDVVVDGTTASANSFNQQTARETRRYVYLHPDDELDEHVRLPEPTTTSRMSASNIDALISEEGLYSGAADSSAPSLPRTPDDDGVNEGVTLADLPWPIPGRIRPTD